MAIEDSGEMRRQTFTQRERRDQIIGVTISLVAEMGYAGVSLSGIAGRAGITKPAVLYYFSSKSSVVEAAYQHVLHRLVEHVGEAVERASEEQGPEAYIRSMLGYLSDNPVHTRMIIEALSSGEDDRDSSARWKPLVDLIQTARSVRGLGPHPDARSAAIIIGGAIDGVLTEQLQDPEYDVRAAVDQLVALAMPVWSA